MMPVGTAFWFFTTVARTINIFLAPPTSITSSVILIEDQGMLRMGKMLKLLLLHLLLTHAHSQWESQTSSNLFREKEKGHKQNTHKGLGESKYKCKRNGERESVRIGGFELNSNYVLSVNLNVKVKDRDWGWSWMRILLDRGCLKGLGLGLGVACRYFCWVGIFNFLMWTVKDIKSNNHCIDWNSFNWFSLKITMIFFWGKA